MAQIAGFDSSFVPNAPTEGLRQAESAPDSARVTPPAEGDAQRPDRQQTAPEDSAAVSGRVAFTTKFGPDETGFPLQIVRGEDLENAETLNLAALQEARQTQASRGALIRAQEAEQRLAEQRSENAAAQTPTTSAPDTGAPESGGQTAPAEAPPAQTAPTVQTGEDTGGGATQSAPAFTPATVASSGGQTETSGGGGATDAARGGGLDVQV
jgi:hypothetical protein